MKVKPYGIREYIRVIVSPFRLIHFNRKWRKINQHNDTFAVIRFPINKVDVGIGTYGPLNIISFNKKDEHLSIGNYCSISYNVVFLLGGEHNYKFFSTYPFLQRVYCCSESLSKGNIIVEDDVWIGYGSIILSGVRLGKGCIVGAGSVVAKDVTPYSIYVNGKVIRYRFSEKVIEKLKAIDFSLITPSVFDRLKIYCQYEINEENVEEIVTFFNNLKNE